MAKFCWAKPGQRSWPRQQYQFQPELVPAGAELHLHIPKVVTPLEQTLVAPLIFSFEMTATVQLSLRFEVVCFFSNSAVFYMKIHTVGV